MAVGDIHVHTGYVAGCHYEVRLEELVGHADWQPALAVVGMRTRGRGSLSVEMVSGIDDSKVEWASDVDADATDWDSHTMSAAVRTRARAKGRPTWTVRGSTDAPSRSGGRTLAVKERALVSDARLRGAR